MVTTKILLLDIETAPSLGWTWGKWEQNVLDFSRDWYILSYSYKWLGEKRVTTKALVDYPMFKRDKENDIALVAGLWKLFDEADITIAHNGDDFDIRKANTRFLFHGLQPPSPYKTVDTLKLARRSFRFDSNKLDDLGRYLGIGRKLPNTGFDLWRRCMLGERRAYQEMKRYNERDVRLLERVYLKLRAWGQHPTVRQGELDKCPRCKSAKIQKRGFGYTLRRRQQRYQCLACGGWWSEAIRK